MANIPLPDHPPLTGLLSLIGNTPLVPIDRINPNPRVKVFAKLERNNPGGSIKDRPALWMIQEGERKGELVPGKILLEATARPGRSGRLRPWRSSGATVPLAPGGG